jgi:hypothetical protein
MIILTPEFGSRVRQRALSSILDGAFAAIPFAVAYFTHHAVFNSGLLQIGLPVVLFAACRFFALTALWPPPDLSWDHKGLEIRWPRELAYIAWSELGGYRLTWDLPRRLRMYRTSGRDPVTINIAAFSDEQRNTLMTEIAMHPTPLPEAT